jgi:hypothetical protein
MLNGSICCENYVSIFILFFLEFRNYLENDKVVNTEILYYLYKEEKESLIFNTMCI